MNTQFTASEIGNIAEKIWLETPKRFPHIYLDTFIVMPNHVHGIVLIDNPKNEIDPKEYLSGSGTESEILNNPLENPTQKQSGGFAGDKNPMLSDNLSGLIRWYKASVSFEARKINKDFAWQTRFHDHIIRSETSYQLISEYIINNPKNWIADKFYP